MPTLEECCQELGVQPGDPRDKIRAAHRKKVLEWHPDFCAAASLEERKKRELKTCRINYAYKLLTDPQMRAEAERAQKLQVGNVDTVVESFKARFAATPTEDVLTDEQLTFQHLPAIAGVKKVRDYFAKGGEGKTTTSGLISYVEATMLTAQDFYNAGLTSDSSGKKCKVVHLGADIGNEDKNQALFLPLILERIEGMSDATYRSWVTKHMERQEQKWHKKLSESILPTTYFTRNIRKTVLKQVDTEHGLKAASVEQKLLSLDELEHLFGKQSEDKAGTLKPVGGTTYSERFLTANPVGGRPVEHRVLWRVDKFDVVKPEELLLPPWVEGKTYGNLAHLPGTSIDDLIQPEVDYFFQDLLNLPINILNVDCGAHHGKAMLSIMLAGEGAEGLVHELCPIIGRGGDAALKEATTTMRALIYTKLARTYESREKDLQERKVRLEKACRKAVKIEARNLNWRYDLAESKVVERLQKEYDGKLSSVRQSERTTYEIQHSSRKRQVLDMLRAKRREDAESLSLVSSGKSKPPAGSRLERLLKERDKAISGIVQQQKYLFLIDRWHGSDAQAPLPEYLDSVIKGTKGVPEYVAFKQEVLGIVGKFKIHPIFNDSTYFDALVNELRLVKKWNRLFGLSLQPQGLYQKYYSEIATASRKGSFVFFEHPECEAVKQAERIVRAMDLGQQMDFSRYNFKFEDVKSQGDEIFGAGAYPESFYAQFACDAPSSLTPRAQYVAQRTPQSSYQNATQSTDCAAGGNGTGSNGTSHPNGAAPISLVKKASSFFSSLFGRASDS